MGALRRFGAFWYDFLVGDDWVAAVGVALALGISALVLTVGNAWWLLPIAVAAILTATVRRGAARASAAPTPDHLAAGDDAVRHLQED